MKKSLLALPIIASSLTSGCYSINSELAIERGKEIIAKLGAIPAENKFAIYGYAGWLPNESEECHIRSFLRDIGSKFKYDSEKQKKEGDLEAVTWFYVPRAEKTQALEDMIVRSRKGEELVLIGHSDGCKNVLETARLLDKLNIPVRDIVYYDAFYTNTWLPGFASSNKIPSNVKKVINFVSVGPFEGRELTKEDCENKETIISNIYVLLDHNEIYSLLTINTTSKEIAQDYVEEAQK